MEALDSVSARATTALMARSCPVCTSAYAEHSLEGLAGCMDDALGWTEDVEGPTLRSLL